MHFYDYIFIFYYSSNCFFNLEKFSYFIMKKGFPEAQF